MKPSDFTRSRRATETNTPKDSINGSPSHLDPRIRTIVRTNSKSQPLYLAKKIENLSDLHSEKEVASPQLSKISEEPQSKQFKFHSTNEKIMSENELDDLNASLCRKEKNIFDEVIQSSKYYEPLKGPLYINGKLVKHSVVGPMDLFSKVQRKISHHKHPPLKSQETEGSFISIGGESNASGAPKLLRLNTGSSVVDAIPTLGTLASSVRRKSIIDHRNRRELLKPETISKKELLTEIENAKARQDTFYNDMQATIKKMRRNDALVVTKQERTLKNFEKIQDHWANILNSTNSKIGRNATESTVVKGDEYRMKKEQIDALELTKPAEERYGHNIWLKTLREDSEFNGNTFKLPRGRSMSNTREKPTVSVEIIRHPGRTSTPGSVWRTSFYRTGQNTTTDKSINMYMQEKIKRNDKTLGEVRALGEGIDTLMLQGENVLNLETEAAFKVAENDDTFPVIIKRKKIEHEAGREEEVIQENCERKYYYTNGFASLKKFKIPRGKSVG